MIMREIRVIHLRSISFQNTKGNPIGVKSTAKLFRVFIRTFFFNLFFLVKVWNSYNKANFFFLSSTLAFLFSDTTRKSSLHRLTLGSEHTDRNEAEGWVTSRVRTQPAPAWRGRRRRSAATLRDTTTPTRLRCSRRPGTPEGRRTGSAAPGPPWKWPSRAGCKGTRRSCGGRRAAPGGPSGSRAPNGAGTNTARSSLSGERGVKKGEQGKRSVMIREQGEGWVTLGEQEEQGNGASG